MPFVLCACVRERGEEKMKACVAFEVEGFYAPGLFVFFPLFLCALSPQSKENTLPFSFSRKKV